jgi:hypothetical protein
VQHRRSPVRPRGRRLGTRTSGRILSHGVPSTAYALEFPGGQIVMVMQHKVARFQQVNMDNPHAGPTRDSAAIASDGSQPRPHGRPCTCLSKWVH